REGDEARLSLRRTTETQRHKEAEQPRNTRRGTRASGSRKKDGRKMRTREPRTEWGRNSSQRDNLQRASLAFCRFLILPSFFRDPLARVPRRVFRGDSSSHFRFTSSVGAGSFGLLRNHLPSGLTVSVLRTLRSLPSWAGARTRTLYSGAGTVLPSLSRTQARRISGLSDCGRGVRPPTSGAGALRTLRSAAPGASAGF